MNKKYISCSYCQGEIEERTKVYCNYSGCGCYCSTECLSYDNNVYYISTLTDKFIEDNGYNWEIKKRRERK